MRRPMPSLLRPTIRLKLTLLYGALFVLMGAALLGVTNLASAATSPAVTVDANGEVRVSIESPLGGGTVTQVAPFGGSAGDVPRLLEAVVAGQHDIQQRFQFVVSAASLIALALVSVVVGWFVAGRVLRPLRTMTAAARAISSTNLALRIAQAGPDDELKDLGATFDDLLGRLERSFEAQRQFVANASHELRTPLARQRAVAQFALSDPEPTLEAWRVGFERILAAEEQQERLLEALFTLARSERGLDRRPVVDLAEVVDSAVRARAVDIEINGLSVEMRLEPAAVRGDPRLLERLVANLLDNAIHHNVPRGQLFVATAVRRRQSTLLVANGGPSIPPTEVDRLFEPFRRLQPDRTTRDDGWGLGLSIVRAIVSAHDGSVRARARDAGGLEVEASIPAISKTTDSRLADAPAPPTEGRPQ